MALPAAGDDVALIGAGDCVAVAELLETGNYVAPVKFRPR